MPPKILIGAGKLAKHAPRPEYAIFAVRRTYESITTKEEVKKVNARFLMFFPFLPIVNGPRVGKNSSVGMVSYPKCSNAIDQDNKNKENTRADINR